MKSRILFDWYGWLKYNINGCTAPCFVLFSRPFCLVDSSSQQANNQPASLMSHSAWDFPTDLAEEPCSFPMMIHDCKENGPDKNLIGLHCQHSLKSNELQDD